MNSRKPDRDRSPEFYDELGDLLEYTLHKHTEMVSPPEDGWRRLEMKLADRSVQPARRGLVAMPMPALQVALVILLIVIGGIKLQSASLSDDALPLLTATLPDSEGEHFVDEYAVSTDSVLLLPATPRPVDPIRTSGVELQGGIRELRLMKSYLRRQKRHNSSENYPLAMAPSDVVPHPMSPAGRLLYAEPDDSNSLFIGNELLHGVSAGLIQ